jgi:CubicO group peptidase (beta-lactamase class C family)
MNKVRKILFIFAFFLTCSSFYAENNQKNVNLKGFSEFVKAMMTEFDVPGAAVAIVKDGKVVFAGGFGYRDVEKKLPVTRQTLFAIGSCSKAFTAALLGILADEGKLEWDLPIQNYLPDFRMQDHFAAEQMTAVDLMSHRCGLPRHDVVWYGSSASRKELFGRLQYLEPSAGFRSTYQYNNLMFMTAGYLAETIMGSSWENLVQTRIFTPLQMTASNFSVSKMQETSDFSLPYTKKDNKVQTIPFRNIDAIGPAGSINSNVSEMGQWILLNLHQGKAGDTQIISESSMKKIHTPQMVTGAGLSEYHELQYNAYGLGWMLSSYRGHAVTSHGGGIDGFISHVSFLPRDKFGVVVLTNCDSSGNALCSVISYHVYDRMLGLKEIPWSTRIKKKMKEADKKTEENKQLELAGRKPNTSPSHDLSEFSGNYENPGYGVLTVKHEQGKLYAEFNNIALQGEHYHYNVFEFSAQAMEDQTFKFMFHPDVKGNITKVSVPFQVGVKDIEFTRMPERKGKEFLQKFAGDYDFSGVMACIALKGEFTLVLQVPGQPPYELQYYRDNEFNLKGLNGFSVKFKLSDSGQVISIESHQPNGVFSAKKVN